MAEKTLQFSVVEPGDYDDSNPGTRSTVAAPGTQADATDMKRMGKAQELNVRDLTAHNQQQQSNIRSVTSIFLPFSDTA